MMLLTTKDIQVGETLRGLYSGDLVEVISINKGGTFSGKVLQSKYRQVGSISNKFLADSFTKNLECDM